MEAILTKLMMPDNEAIQQGTAELKEAFKQPGAIPAFCEVLATSESPQIRQFGSLLLRKKLAKKKTWANVSLQDRAAIKNVIGTTLMNETSVVAQHGVCQLISVIAKWELPTNSWPELLVFLKQCFENPDPQKKALAMYLSTTLCETCGDTIKDRYYKDFIHMFKKSLGADQDVKVRYRAVVAMTSLAPHIGSPELPLFQPLVGGAIEAIKFMVSSGNMDEATEAMDLFDELFESEVAIVVPHIKPIIELCLAIAAEKSLDDGLRVKAITFIGSLVRLKKKAIVKHKLYIPIINTIFPVMCVLSDEEDSDDEDDPIEQNSPSVSAAQTLDLMAINLPPEKFMQALQSHLQPAMQSADPALQKGAFDALAVVAEGCSEHIRKKHLRNFLQYIDSGIKVDHQAVRSAALYALGQFFEFLQPDINEFAGSILPVLFGYLEQACVDMVAHPDKKMTRGLDRVFYALEISCENLESKLTPYLEPLLKQMFFLIDPAKTLPVKMKQYAISAIGAVANAVKAGIVPFFEEIITPLKTYLTVPPAGELNGGDGKPAHLEEDAITLLTQSMDTLGCLARAVGPTNFIPSLAEECCKLGIELQQKYDDPDVRKAAFGLYGAVAFVAKENMAAALPGLVEQMLVSATSTEGVSLEMKNDSSAGLPLEELSDPDESGDEEIGLNGADSSVGDLEQIKAINVENSYKEEKETAIESLKELCVSCGPEAFLPYLPKCLEDVWPLVEYPHEDVKRVAIEAVTHFTAAYYIKLPKGGAGDLDRFNELATTKLIPKLLKLIKEDDSVNVVCTCLDMLAELLKTCGPPIVAIPGYPEEIVKCVHLVMKAECACMDSDTAEDLNGGYDDVSEEAEQDELVFEYAGDILPSLGIALNDSGKFAVYFAGILPHLLKRAKRNATTAEKSFAAGSIAECMKPLAGNLDRFINHVLQVFQSLIHDEDDDVRNNSVFGLGELALHGGPSMHAHFPAILQTLSKLIGHEQAPRVQDQVVGAVCRLIVANKDLVPLQDVLPVVMSKLPLREDFDEYLPVYKMIQVLFADGNPMIKEAIPLIVKFSVDLQNTTEEYEREKVIPELIASLRLLVGTFPTEIKALLATYEPSQTASLVKELNM